MDIYYNEEKTEAVLKIGEEYLTIAEDRKETGKDFEYFCESFREWYYIISSNKRNTHSLKELFREYLVDSLRTL